MPFSVWEDEPAETKETNPRTKCVYLIPLTHCGLETSYAYKDLGKYRICSTHLPSSFFTPGIRTDWIKFDPGVRMDKSVSPGLRKWQGG